ncbi:MAG TPA: DJ-1/PfpI family protein [Candidatus Binataceae bacterium]|nr:DJ-1/PfpI family protein [Candidatus Binataceae bacterium]
MTEPLKRKRIAILPTDGVEQSELTEPRKALDQAGANTVIIAPGRETIRTSRGPKDIPAFDRK